MKVIVQARHRVLRLRLLRTRASLVLVVCALGVLVHPAAGKPVDLPAVTAPVIEVLDPSGAITQDAVRDALAPIQPELARCAAEVKWKGDALAWVVSDWKGKVTKLELAVDRPAVETCFAKSLKTIVIGKAKVRATTVLRLRVGT